MSPLEKLLEKLKELLQNFDLESEMESHDNIHAEILKGIVFKGTNLWILVFAIIVASVGLNMNSTAVIIGAMLISPLMGPINGMGYSIATYNFELFRRSVKNFSFAVITSLVASTSYFALSPISTAQSELLARTSPSIYDVLIALFGGLAGIVAISSRQKGNVIPGVAIATALMPPLCTAGYGLATGNLNYFFGALYLFTINTVFIALAAVAISQFLRLPIRTLVDPAQRTKVNRIISLITVVVLLPSIYFGYGLVQKEKFIEKANRYVSNVSSYEGHYLLKSEIDPSKREINLIYGGMSISEDQKEAIINSAMSFELGAVKVNIKRGLALDALDDVFDQKNNETIRLRDELSMTQYKLKVKEMESDSIENQKKMGNVLLNEIKPLFPQISGCYYAHSYAFTDSTQMQIPTTMVLFSIKYEMPLQEEQDKIESWVKRRLGENNIQVLYINPNEEKNEPIEELDKN